VGALSQRPSFWISIRRGVLSRDDFFVATVVGEDRSFKLAVSARHLPRWGDVIDKGDVAKVGPILRTVLSPFRVSHEVERCILRGALDLGVCASKSSGGALPDYSETDWMPMEFMTSARSAG
jgi:hypothetical protein